MTNLRYRSENYYRENQTGMPYKLLVWLIVAVRCEGGCMDWIQQALGMSHGDESSSYPKTGNFLISFQRRPYTV
jgi:hypothetical protein